MIERQTIEHKRIYEPKEEELAKRFSDKLKKDGIKHSYAQVFTIGGRTTIITWIEKKDTKNPKK